jgi:hypothetical protein
MNTLTQITRLVESADQQMILDISLKILTLQGYKNTRLTDGWNDGGSDFRLLRSSQSDEVVIAQATVVQKNWTSKLLSDAKKAKAKLNATRMYVFHNKRLDEVRWKSIESKSYKDNNVTLIKYDSQAIAAYLIANDKVNELFSILNIDIKEISRVNELGMDSFKCNVLVATLTLDENLLDFKKSVIEGLIISSLHSSNLALSEIELVDTIKSELKLGNVDNSYVQSIIDNLRSRGAIIGAKNQLTLSIDSRGQYDEQLLIREADIQLLRRQISEYVQLQNPNFHPDDIDLDSILSSVGSYYTAVSKDLLESIDNHRTFNLTNPIKRRMVTLRNAVKEIGINDELQISSIIENIIEIVGKSPLSYYFVASELLFCWSKVSIEHVLRSYSNGRRIRFFLDSSVCIPILCCQLFGKVSERFSYFSYEAFQKVNNGVNVISISSIHVEEIASHLIYCDRDYREVIDLDPILAYSQNAFVGHFVGLINLDEQITFEEFLDMLGLSKDLRRHYPYDANSFFLVRDRLVQKITKLLSNLNVKVVETIPKDLKNTKTVENEISYINNSIGLDRESTLINHDVMVVSYLIEQSIKEDELYAIITWDSIYFRIKESRNDEWDALDPSNILDLLFLIESDGNAEFFSAPLNIVKSVSEVPSRKAALVWDNFVQLAKEDLREYKYKSKSKQFKDQYLENNKKEVSREDVRRAWESYKIKFT